MLAPWIFRRAVTLAAVAGAVALAGAAVPARGSATPPWRVVATIGPAAGVTYVVGSPGQGQGLVATGSRDAWSVWSSCAPPCGAAARYRVRHWDGASWKRVSPPGLTFPVVIGASSNRNAWLFNVGRSQNGQPPASTAVHWDGTAWSVHALPPWVITSNRAGLYSLAVSVFGPKDVWAFSLGQTYVGRYNGRRWAKVPLPAIPTSVSDVGRNDIWALADRLTGSNRQVLMHWNGGSWRIFTLPKVHVPAGATVYLTNLLATGAHDVWLARDILQGQAGARTLYLLHWNGTTWRRVRMHYPTSFVDSVASDGHGGIWMAAIGRAPGYRWFFYNLNGRQWSRQRVPATKGSSLQQIQTISGIPGTTSMWGVGEILLPHEGSGGVVGAIWKYGA